MVSTISSCELHYAIALQIKQGTLTFLNFSYDFLQPSWQAQNSLSFSLSLPLRFPRLPCKLGFSEKVNFCNGKEGVKGDDKVRFTNLGASFSLFRTR